MTVSTPNLAILDINYAIIHCYGLTAARLRINLLALIDVSVMAGGIKLCRKNTVMYCPRDAWISTLMLEK